jgi:G:T-mismatch repair DNA endonuclease (very short patch repair protein)
MIKCVFHHEYINKDGNHMKDLKCLICGYAVTNNGSYIGSHVKRKHGLLLNEYVTKYYENLTDNFIVEKCGFCDKEAITNFVIDHKTLTYKLNYDNGYWCQTCDCKDNISKLIFNNPYNKKQFEHIGANTTYLSLLYKKDIEKVKYDKSKGFRESNWTVTLENYVNKYGETEGKKLYLERNNKVGKANTLLYYEEKFGEIEGNIKYDEYRKRRHKYLGPTKSNKSKLINTILNKNLINYVEEYKYTNETKRNGSIDFYLTDYNIIIEYYGDYWHCNPNVYEKNYYHKILKRFAYEIWEKDKERINYIFEKEFKKNIAILIIWESTKFTEEYFLQLLNEIKNKYTIFEI